MFWPCSIMRTWCKLAWALPHLGGTAAQQAARTEERAGAPAADQPRRPLCPPPPPAGVCHPQAAPQVQALLRPRAVLLRGRRPRVAAQLPGGGRRCAWLWPAARPRGGSQRAWPAGGTPPELWVVSLAQMLPSPWGCPAAGMLTVPRPNRPPACLACLSLPWPPLPPPTPHPGAARPRQEEGGARCSHAGGGAPWAACSSRVWRIGLFYSGFCRDGVRPEPGCPRRATATAARRRRRPQPHRPAPSPPGSTHPLRRWGRAPACSPSRYLPAALAGP